MELILASGSPRRKELLAKITKEFTVLPSDYDESILQNTLTDPAELVKQLAFHKAEDSWKHHFSEEKQDYVIIGSDTLVYFEGTILGKPKDKQDAISTLQKIQNKVNSIYTGMCMIIQQDGQVFTKNWYEKADVYMKPMSKKDIIEYVESGEPLDKAGSYAIQGIGKKYIQTLVGDFDTAVGLDTKGLTKMLKQYQIIEGEKGC